MKREVLADGPGIIPLLTAAEVAAMFGVTVTQVGRWAKDGRFPEGAVVTTPGGRRRFREDTVRALLEQAGAR